MRSTCLKYGLVLHVWCWIKVDFQLPGISSKVGLSVFFEFPDYVFVLLWLNLLASGFFVVKKISFAWKVSWPWCQYLFHVAIPHAFWRFWIPILPWLTLSPIQHSELNKRKYGSQTVVWAVKWEKLDGLHYMSINCKYIMGSMSGTVWEFHFTSFFFFFLLQNYSIT